MPPKDRCIHCGRPCVGRFCYTHLGEILDAESLLRRTDPETWARRVDQANAEHASNYPPEQLEK